jgi:alkylation response protein AidB-like acyl-CoA dehydrogenase
LEGEWEFSSGSYACEWLVLVTPIETPDGPGRPIWCVLPRRDWQILDTWHVSGLRATASHNVFVPGAFVASAFTCPANNRVFGDPLPLPGWSVNPGYIYQLPQELFPFNVTTPALGIARGALDAFVGYLAGRPDRANLVQRHLRIAESSAEIDAAEALLLADSAEIERRGRAGGPWTPEFLARLRRDVSYAVVLCTRAVDRLASAVGAHGLAHDSAFQRAFRDVHAVANHAGANWDLHSIPYARALLGLPPQ